MIPRQVTELAEQRQAARAAKEFAEADRLRDQIEAAGFIVTDTPEGPELEPKPRFDRVDPASIQSCLDQPATMRASLQLLHEGHIEDLARFLGALRATTDLSDIETVVVDPATADAEQILELIADVPNGRSVHLDTDPGWGGSRNAGMKTSVGEFIVLADLSIEPKQDLLAPLLEALEADPRLAVTGPIGIVTTDMREWHEAATEVCDAIEGYLFATRRDLLRRIDLIDERFTWYRNADIHLSLRLREEAGGAPAKITPVAFDRHEHRGYAKYPEGKIRDRESRRNYNRVLDRYRNARDLLTGAPAKG
ncbi:MAG: glycosyltransferase [Actinomycetota bacterium]